MEGTNLLLSWFEPIQNNHQFSQNFTNMLKQTYTLVFVILFVGTAVFAQKNVDLDRKYVQLSHVDLPDEKVDTSWKTYRVQVDNSENFMAGGYPLDALESRKFLSGYLHDRTNPDLFLRLSSSRVAATSVDIKSKSTTTKDKSGKETTTYTYWYDLVYSYTAYATLSKKNGAVLQKLQYGGSDKHDIGPSYSTHAAANDAYMNSRGNIVAGLLKKEVEAMVTSTNSTLNRSYGFVPKVSTFNLWEIGTKKHPEYEAFTANSDKCASTIKSQITVNGTLNAAKESLKPIIEYYQQIPGKFTSDEKGDKKIRYAAYYNLALIYFALEDFEKVKENANLLIKNDFDVKDGEEWIKQVEALQKQFQVNGFVTRHFDREGAIKKSLGIVTP